MKVNNKNALEIPSIDLLFSVHGLEEWIAGRNHHHKESFRINNLLFLIYFERAEYKYKI